MIDWSQWAEEPNKSNLNEYPTITDIVEDIIGEEEDRVENKYPLLHNRTIFSKLKTNGCYFMMSQTGDNTNIELLPASKSGMTYYRGQSIFHSPCKPSLYREEKQINRNILISSLQTAELICCLRKHPVIWDIMMTRLNYDNKLFNVPIPIHFEGLAQHYGIKTSFLDITANKWVAAFFAITLNEDERYFPVDTTNPYHPRYGVFYRYSWQKPDGGMRNDEIHAIGQHYFNRPGKQSALVINLREQDDFNMIDGVEKVFFRHDNKATKLIYDLCQQGRIFFPNDSLSSTINAFIKGTTYSEEAVACCNKTYYPFVEYNRFLQWIYENGLSISSNPQMVFDAEKMDIEYQLWLREGKQRFLDNIYAIPMMKIPKEQ